MSARDGGTPLVIRAVVDGDRSDLRAMLEATGLFPSHELDEVMTMLASHLDGSLPGEHRWAVALEADRIVGAAYWAPERLTDGTWNLYMLAVDPGWQGSGVGRRLVGHAERQAAGEGVRLMLVETLGIPEFEPQRTFYSSCGYEAEAQVREFYGPGLDKIIFRKLLA